MKQRLHKFIPALLVLALLQACFEDCDLPGCEVDGDCPKPYSRCLDGACFLPDPEWQRPFCHLNPDPGEPCCDLERGADCLLPFPSAGALESPPAPLGTNRLAIGRATSQTLALTLTNLTGTEVSSRTCPLGSSSRPFAPLEDAKGGLWVVAGQSLCRFPQGEEGALTRVLEAPLMLAPTAGWEAQTILVSEQSITSLNTDAQVLWEAKACEAVPLGGLFSVAAGTFVLACPGYLEAFLPTGQTAFRFQDPRLGAAPLSMAAFGSSLALALADEVLVMDATLGSEGGGWFRLDLGGRGPLSNVVFTGPGRVAVLDAQGRLWGGAAENGGVPQPLGSLPCSGAATIEALEGEGLLAVCPTVGGADLLILPPDNPPSVLTPGVATTYSLGSLGFQPDQLLRMGRGLALLGDQSQRALVSVNFAWRTE
jgi:hypothetical protein